MLSLLFLPIFLLTILYTVNISFLRKKELPLVWKNTALIFNVLAFLCSIPTAYIFSLFSLLDAQFGDGSDGFAKVIIGAMVVYFFFVNIILSFLLIRKNAIQSKKPDHPQERAVFEDNKKLKLLSFAFLIAGLGILVYRAIYADENEILFTKGHLEGEFFFFYFFILIFFLLASAFIISLKNTEFLKVTTVILGVLFAIFMLLNIVIKPNDYAALSRAEKEDFLELSVDHLEELYSEGIEISDVKYKKSALGGNYIQVKFNYHIKECEHPQCGPYAYKSDYQIKWKTQMDTADSGQMQVANGQTIVSENNKDVSFTIENENYMMVKEEKETFVEEGNKAELKEQVFKLIEEGYDYTSNNGLPTRPDHHFDRLKFTKQKNNDYKELLAMDENEFYENLLEDRGSSEDGTKLYYPLGSNYGKIVVEVHPDGYLVKGLPFKTVDSRPRFHFNMGNGENFTGILESDDHFRTDRVWVTVEKEESATIKKGEFLQVNY